MREIELIGEWARQWTVFCLLRLVSYPGLLKISGIKLWSHLTTEILCLQCIQDYITNTKTSLFLEQNSATTNGTEIVTNFRITSCKYGRGTIAVFYLGILLEWQIYSWAALLWKQMAWSDPDWIKTYTRKILSVCWLENRFHSFLNIYVG